jgi:gliding motility-associated-like protein
MNRFNALLIAGFVWLCAITSVSAQGPTFEMTPANITANVNDVVAVQVKVKNFNAILSFQYSMNWDPTKLQYLNNGTSFGVSGLAASNFGTTETNQGRLSLSWFDNTLAGITLPDGTIAYTISYKVLMAGPVGVIFSGNPVDIEVYNATDPNPISNTSVFSNLQNGGSSTTTQALAIGATTGSGATGTDICIGVYAESGFTSIKKAKFTMAWDPSKMAFKETKNYGLAGFTAANVSAASGAALVDWSSANPVTLTANTKLYDVCFSALSAATTTADVSFTAVEFVSGAPNTTVAPTFTKGTVTIIGNVVTPVGCSSTTVTPPPTCNQPVGFTGTGFKIGQITAAPNSNLCVDVVAQDFTNIAAMQFSYKWDPNVLSLVSVKMISPLPLPNLTNTNFDQMQVSSGKLGFIWDDPTAAGVTIPNNTPIYQLCFAVVGSAGSSTSIKFTADPISIELTNGQSGTVTPKFQDGTVTIEAPLAINGVVTDATCFGKSTGAINLSGGAATNHYYWTGPNGFKCNDINLSGLPAGLYNVTVTSTTCQSFVKTYEVKQPTTALLATSTVTDAVGTCDGQASVTPVGGTPNYTYQWTSTSPTPVIGTGASIIGKCEGEYRVTVTDSKGCTANTKVYIGQALSFENILVKNVKCNGDKNGSVKVIAKGGDGNYKYVWGAPFQSTTLDSISAVAAGTYQVTVTDGNNKSIFATTIKVVEPAILTATVGNKTPAPNGLIEITTTGGTGIIKYAWSNGQSAATATNLDKGIYSVTLTDANGCQKIVSGIEILGTTLTATTQNIKKATCDQNNGSAEILTTGGSGSFTYLWNPGGYTTAAASNLTPGAYSITITDTKWGGNVVKNITIDKVEKTTVALATKTDAGSGCVGTLNITVDKGTPSYTFSWKGPNNFVSTSQNLTGLCDGAYTVTVSDANACQTVQTFTIDPGGLSATAVYKETSCPNTADGNITLAVGGGNAPYAYKWSTGATTKDLTAVAAGKYTVTITDNSTPKLTKTVNFTLLSKSNLAIDTIQLVLPSLGCTKADGAAIVVVSGGTPTYSFLYSGVGSGTGATRAGLACGAYTVSVTDKQGCTVSKLFTIGDDSPVQIISLTNFKGVNVKCFGDKNARVQVVAVKGGKAPFAYNWSSGSKEDIAGGLGAGVVKVTVTDATGTAFSGSITVIEPDKLDASLKLTDIINGNDGAAEVAIKGGTLPYTWTWSDALKTQNINPLTGLGGGTIAALVRDANGCEVMTQAEIRRPGVNCLEALAVVTPNGDGKNDFLIIHCLDDFSNKSNHLEVYSRWGQIVYKKDNYDNDWDCKTPEGYDLPEGAYYYVIQVTKTNGTIEQVKGYFNVVQDK